MSPRVVDKCCIWAIGHQLLSEIYRVIISRVDLRILVAGVYPKLVQEFLGHSPIAMILDVYSHVLPSMQQDAAKSMDDMFKDM